MAHRRAEVGSPALPGRIWPALLMRGTERCTSEQRRGSAEMIRTLGEAERACVFRMGRFYRVAGPGAVFSIPLIDHLAVVDLDRTIPEWREAYPEEVNAMVEFLVTRYPKVPSHLSLEEIREAIYPSAGGSDPSG